MGRPRGSQGAQGGLEEKSLTALIIGVVVLLKKDGLLTLQESFLAPPLATLDLR